MALINYATAIQALAPGAEWSMTNADDYSTLSWFSVGIPQPTQAECDNEMAQQAQQEAQQKTKELELKQAEIQRKALETHQDMTMQWEKLEGEKQEAAAQLQESVLRYQAEMQRVGADLQINHSQNLIKMLTHHGQIFHETFDEIIVFESQRTYHPLYI